MALKTITIIDKITYLLLQLPFGVANGQSKYGTINEPIMDLTNELLRDNIWNPTKLHSPLQSQLDEPDSRYDITTPFSLERKLNAEVPYHPASADGYIDYIITILDKTYWVK